MLVFVGTYTESVSPTGEKSEGIYAFRIHPQEGVLTPVQVAGKVINPSFLAVHPNRHFLYAVNEVGEFRGEAGGGVSAFSIDAQTGELRLISQQLSQGSDPCYLSCDATGTYVLVANYSSGSLSLLPLQPDGRLYPAVEVIQHHGSGFDPSRQAGPHVHSVVLDPTNRFVLTADLGLDQVMVYRLDLERGKLIPMESQGLKLRAGSGPRHLAFHPNGRFVYLVCELNSTLGAYMYHAEDGRLEEIGIYPMLPEGYRGISWAAEVQVAPSGRFLYASNRGHDSLVIYAVDEASGRLVYVGHASTRGEYPRHFALDPSGTLLLVANQNSGTILPFWVEAQTGKLTPTGQVVKVPTPVYVKIFQEE